MFNRTDLLKQLFNLLVCCFYTEIIDVRWVSEPITSITTKLFELSYLRDSVVFMSPYVCVEKGKVEVITLSAKHT